MLLRQLLDVDNELFNLSELADMILAQPLLGSTVKCDGNESDPYAFLTVLNLHTHRSKQVISQLTQYLLSRTTGQQQIAQHLRTLLAPESPPQVGLILTERFINMPHQIVPPMYNMLLEEIQWALDEGEPYQFSHYLILSKTYTEVESTLEGNDEDRPQKKKAKVKNQSYSPSASGSTAEDMFYFHPEDEALQKHALATCNFEYEKQGEEGSADSKRAFQDLGVRPQGNLILIESAKFKAAVKAVEEYLGSQS